MNIIHNAKDEKDYRYQRRIRLLLTKVTRCTLKWWFKLMQRIDIGLCEEERACIDNKELMWIDIGFSKEERACMDNKDLIKIYIGLCKVARPYVEKKELVWITKSLWR